MKKVLLVASVLFTSVYSSYASGNSNVSEKLSEVVKFENNSLSISKNETAFVKVSFKVNQNGKIEVLATNYSDENIKEKLMEKLNQITLENQHDVDEVYYYNFTFKKM